MAKPVEATLEVNGEREFVAWRWSNVGSRFQEFVEAAKRVPGARFQRAGRYWRAPATIDACTALRGAYGSELAVLAPLADWYRIRATEAAQREEQAMATDASLDVLPQVAPRLAETLRPDQRAGAAFIAAGYRGSTLVADKPGLGKTLETIAGVLEAQRTGNILVTCPKISVRNVWFRELERWTDETVYMARGTRAQRERSIAEFMADPAERKWLIIVAEMLRVKRQAPDPSEPKSYKKKRGRIEGYEYPEIFGVEWDTIISDESQKLLGSLSIAKSNLAGEGLQKLRQPDDRRRYAMSGTPFGKGGRVQGMFGTLNWLWPDEFTSFWKWVDRHFETEEEYIGKGKTAKKIVGLRGGVEEEQFLRNLGPRILRRTKEEVLPNLPPKQHYEVLCEMGPKQRKQYRQLTDDAEVVLPDGGGILIANGVLAEITRAKQIANGVVAAGKDGGVIFTEESCKIDALMEKLDARGILSGEGDTKVIVASRFNSFIDHALLPRLRKEGVDFHLLMGKTSDKARDTMMDHFQGDEGPRVFVMNSAAGGVSVTLDAADEVHMLDELDNPEDNEQVEDRAHRASRMHQVDIYYYRTEGTYDTNIGASVEAKRKEQFKVLDGRRGIQDIRNMIRYKEK